MRGHVVGLTLDALAQGDLAGAEADVRASLEGLRRTTFKDEMRKSALELARVLRLRGDEAGAAAIDAATDAPADAAAAPACMDAPAAAPAAVNAAAAAEAATG